MLRVNDIELRVRTRRDGTQWVSRNDFDAAVGVEGGGRDALIAVSALGARLQQHVAAGMLSSRAARHIARNLRAPQPEAAKRDAPTAPTEIANLCAMYAAVKDDDVELGGRILRSLRAYEAQVAPLFDAAHGYVRVTQRVRQLHPDAAELDAEDARAIGRRAALLHVQRYGRVPPKIDQRVGDAVRQVNAYTQESAPHTLDVAIREYFEED